MEVLSLLNQNTYLSAVSMLMLNLGSRYLSFDLGNAQERFLKSWGVRKITLFCVFYVATRDILISLMLTGVFVIITSGLFHEESKFCILPSSVRKDLKITREEYEAAKKVVSLYDAYNRNTSNKP
jgi:hypothetical protein